MKKLTLNLTLYIFVLDTFKMEFTYADGLYLDITLKFSLNAKILKVIKSFGYLVF